jgi:hypothetical protein
LKILWIMLTEKMLTFHLVKVKKTWKYILHFFACILFWKRWMTLILLRITKTPWINVTPHLKNAQNQLIFKKYWLHNNEIITRKMTFGVLNKRRLRKL